MHSAYEATLRAVCESQAENKIGLTKLVVQRFAEKIPEDTLHKISEAVNLLATPAYKAAESIMHLNHINESARYSMHGAEAAQQLNRSVMEAKSEHEKIERQLQRMQSCKSEVCLAGTTASMTLRLIGHTLPDFAHRKYLLRIMNRRPTASMGSCGVYMIPIPFSGEKTIHFDVNSHDNPESELICCQLVSVSSTPSTGTTSKFSCKCSTNIRVKNDFGNMDVIRQVNVPVRAVCTDIVPMDSCHRIGKKMTTHWSIRTISFGEGNDPLVSLHIELFLPECSVPDHNEIIDFVDTSTDTVEEASKFLEQLYEHEVCAKPWAINYEEMFDVASRVMCPTAGYRTMNPSANQVLDIFAQKYELGVGKCRLLQTLRNVEEGALVPTDIIPMINDIQESFRWATQENAFLVGEIKKHAEISCIRIICSGLCRQPVLADISTIYRIFFPSASQEEIQQRITRGVCDYFEKEVQQSRAKAMEQIDVGWPHAEVQSIILMIALKSTIDEKFELSFVNRLKSFAQVHSEHDNTSDTTFALSILHHGMKYAHGYMVDWVQHELLLCVPEVLACNDVLHDQFYRLVVLLTTAGGLLPELQELCHNNCKDVLLSWAVNKLPNAIMGCTRSALDSVNFVNRSSFEAGTLFMSSLYGLHNRGHEMFESAPRYEGWEVHYESFVNTCAEGVRDYMNQLRDGARKQGSASDVFTLQHLYLMKKHADEFFDKLMVPKKKDKVHSQYSQALMKFVLTEPHLLTGLGDEEKKVVNGAPLSSVDVICVKMSQILGTCKIRGGHIVPKNNVTRSLQASYEKEKDALVSFLGTKLLEVLQSYDLTIFPAVKDFPQGYFRAVVTAFERFVLTKDQYRLTRRDVAILHDTWTSVVQLFEDQGNGLPNTIIRKNSDHLIMYFQFYSTPTADLITYYDAAKDTKDPLPGSPSRGTTLRPEYVLDILMSRDTDPSAVEYIRKHTHEEHIRDVGKSQWVIVEQNDYLD